MSKENPKSVKKSGLHEVLRIEKGQVFIEGKPLSDEAWNQIQDLWKERDKITERRSKIFVNKTLEVVEECKRIYTDPLDTDIFYDFLKYHLPEDRRSILDEYDEYEWDAREESERALVVNIFKDVRPNPAILQDLPEEQRHFRNLAGKTAAEMTDEELKQFILCGGLNIARLQDWVLWAKEDHQKGKEPFNREDFLQKYPIENLIESVGDDPLMLEYNLLWIEHAYYVGVGNYHEQKFQTMDAYVAYLKKYRSSYVLKGRPYNPPRTIFFTETAADPKQTFDSEQLKVIWGQELDEKSIKHAKSIFLKYDDIKTMEQLTEYLVVDAQGDDLRGINFDYIYAMRGKEKYVALLDKRFKEYLKKNDLDVSQYSPDENL